MKSIVDRRLEADQKKSDFFANMDDVRMKLSPDYVVDKLLRAVDPDFAILRRMEERARSNPMALLAAVGGLNLLARQLMTRQQNQSPKTLKQGRRSRLVRSILKGDHHGNIDSAKRD
jgi:hypothetical protein